MTRSKLFLTTIVAALAAFPAAGATWYVHGTYEPDTAQDAADGFMFADPDTTKTGKQIYFNAWADMSSSGVNPNSGVTGTRLYTFPIISFQGMLGVWKDCNGDGFVGMADGALWEYRAEAILGSDTCVGTDHIRSGWVWEFHWIGPQDNIGNTGDDGQYEAFGPAGLYNDTDARMWVDWGLPGERPGETCVIGLAAGSTATTGGMIDTVDCLLGRRIQAQLNAADPGCDTPTPDLRLCMPEDDPQSSGSVVNQQLPHLWHDPYHPDSTGLYEQGSGDPAFQAYDCSSGSETLTSPTGQVRVDDPTGQVPEDIEVNGATLITGVKDENGTIVSFLDEEGTVYSYSVPSPAVLDPQGSYYDGFNNTADGALDGCDTSDGNDEFVWVNAETARGAVDPDEVPRNRNANAFRFWGTQATLLNWGVVGDCTGTDENDNPFPPGCEESSVCVTQDEEGNWLPEGCKDHKTRDLITQDTPDDFGIQIWRSALGISWSAVGTWSTDPQLVDRDTLQPQGPIYATYYAYVSPQTLAKGATVPGQPGVYGAEWCGGATTGGVNGFDCDASHWWNPLYDANSAAMPVETGGTISTQCTTGRLEPADNCRELGVKPGQVYQLRDIDCWNGQLARSVPAHASLVPVSGQPDCQDAA